MQFVIATPQGPPYFCLSEKCSVIFEDDLKGKIHMEQWGSSSQNQWSAIKKTSQASALAQVCEDTPTVDHNLEAPLPSLRPSKKWQQQKKVQDKLNKMASQGETDLPHWQHPQVCVSQSGADGQTQTHRKRSCSTAAVLGFDTRQSNCERFKSRVLDLFFLLKVVWTHFNAKRLYAAIFLKKNLIHLKKGQIFLSEESNENADSHTGNWDVFYEHIKWQHNDNSSFLIPQQKRGRFNVSRTDCFFYIYFPHLCPRRYGWLFSSSCWLKENPFWFLFLEKAQRNNYLTAEALCQVAGV